MKKNKLTEEELKNKLQISDFRELSKEKVMDFISLIPKVDKEIALSAINQFPNFSNMSSNIIGGLLVLCNNALDNVKSSNTEVIESYKSILISLQEQVNNDSYSFEDKMKINNQMIDIANKIAEVNDKKNIFIKELFQTGANIVCGALILGVIILNVDID